MELRFAAIALLALGLGACRSGADTEVPAAAPSPSEVITPAPPSGTSPTTPVEGGAGSEMGIRVASPRPQQLVRSPLSVSGSARGSWYFEGSFPITLLDANGAVLARAPAQAQAKGEWMTTELVPFSATLSFKQPSTATGQLLLAKDNPSGDPANAQEIRIPVNFAVAGAAGTGKDSGVRGTATIGPACPVERMPPDPACADKPIAATFSIDTVNGAHVATISSTTRGSFSLPLSLDSGIR